MGQQDTKMHIFVIMLMSMVLAADSSDYIVHTPVGSIRGIAVPFGQDMIYQFRNIPYAKPPVGNLRFRKPVAYGSWSGLLDGSQFGPSCMQENSLSYFRDLENKNVSEDCLSLNIYVPHQIHNTRQPKTVMVWVHGGAYVVGQGQLYDGSALSSRGDVVVVTINYRLGFFGFLSTGDDAARGNYGLWDQHLAFRWIKDNIASFGGNPNSVTIFGESAGGFSVSLQSLATQNKGLFQRVIAQSGVSNSLLATANKYLLHAKKYGMLLGCIDSMESNISNADLVSCMRQKSADQLLSAESSFFLHSDNRINFEIPYAPVVDGEFLVNNPRNILQNKLSKSYRMFKSLDFMSGNCNNEGSLFFNTLEHLSSVQHHNFSIGVPTSILCDNITHGLQQYMYPNVTAASEISSAICNEYKRSDLAEQARQMTNMYSDLFFLAPTATSLDSHSNDNPQRYTYQYMFNIPALLNFDSEPPPTWFHGSAHASELIFLFGQQVMSNMSAVPESYFRLSENMLKYWTNFAKTGNPNAAGLSFWPQYEKTHRSYINLDTSISEKTHAYRDRVDFWLRIMDIIYHNVPMSVVPNPIG